MEQFGLVIEHAQVGIRPHHVSQACKGPDFLQGLALLSQIWCVQVVALMYSDHISKRHDRRTLPIRKFKLQKRKIATEPISKESMQLLMLPLKLRDFTFHVCMSLFEPSSRKKSLTKSNPNKCVMKETLSSNSHFRLYNNRRVILHPYIILRIYIILTISPPNMNNTVFNSKTPPLFLVGHGSSLLHLDSLKIFHQNPWPLSPFWPGMKCPESAARPSLQPCHATRLG